MGRLVILIEYTQGRPAAGQPWAGILRTVGARLNHGAPKVQTPGGERAKPSYFNNRGSQVVMIGT